MIYIFWTCKDKIEVKRIIYGLLKQKLIACASIFPGIQSIYRWEGEIEEELEVKAILKTLPECFDAVQKYIQSHCSYEVPEILQVDVVRGNPAYLSWVANECNRP